jgi:PAS domain-containing protein
VQSAIWIDAGKRIRAVAGSPSQALRPGPTHTEVQLDADGDYALQWAMAQHHPVYTQSRAGERGPLLLLFVPLIDRAASTGAVLVELSVDALYRYAVPNEISARYAVSIQDARGNVLAGVALPPKKLVSEILPWSRKPGSYAMAVSPVGADLMIRAEAYRASMGVVGTGLFWLVTALSVMTGWMLIANWRHSRQRLKAQQALLAETNFRRAMENSMLTGMRAMDLQGRITYVNAAFCMMTGWSESELVGRTAPFPYWPDSDREELTTLLGQELAGKTTQGGVNADQVVSLQTTAQAFHFRGKRLGIRFGSAYLLSDYVSSIGQIDPRIVRRVAFRHFF